MAFVGKTNATSSNVTTLSITRTGVTAGNLLVLKVSWENLTTTTIATPSGWTSAENPTGRSNGVTQNGSSIFYKENAPSGSNSASITLDATSAGDATIEEHDDHPTSGTLDVHTNNGGTTGTSGNTGTTATAKLNAMVAAAIGVNTGTGPAADGLSSPATSGYTSSGSWTNEATNSGGEHSYKLYATAAGQIASWTWTSNSAFVATIATFKVTDKNYSAAGVATVTGTGAATAAVPFNAAETATVTGAGASVASAAGSITASATVVGDAKSTAAGAYSSVGTATVVGDAKSTAAGNFNSAGVLTVVGDNPGGGATIVSAAASSVSTATVTGSGQSTASAGFSAAGTATLVGTAAATVAANGNIVVTGVLTGASASSARRRNDGWKPKKREDDFLMELAEMLVPVLHANQHGA